MEYIYTSLTKEYNIKQKCLKKARCIYVKNYDKCQKEILIILQSANEEDRRYRNT